MDKVRHVVIWTLKDEYTDTQKREITSTFKKNLEAASKEIAGVISADIYIDILDSSNADLMLVLDCESKEALAAYQKNPKHLECANYLRPNVQVRSCIDYKL